MGGPISIIESVIFIGSLRFWFFIQVLGYLGFQVFSSHQRGWDAELNNKIVKLGSCSSLLKSSKLNSIQKKRSRADVIIQMHPPPTTHNFLKLVEGWFSLSFSFPKLSKYFYQNFQNIFSKSLKIFFKNFQNIFSKVFKIFLQKLPKYFFKNVPNIF